MVSFLVVKLYILVAYSWANWDPNYFHLKWRVELEERAVLGPYQPSTNLT